MVKLRPKAPVKPDLALFTDEHGQVDHEAYDNALEIYFDAYDAWYAEYGIIEEQIELAWQKRGWDLLLGI